MSNKPLIVLPGYCDALGGTILTMESTLSGFRLIGADHRVKMLVRAGSFMEQYFLERGHNCLQPIIARDQRQFWWKALAWAMAQPASWPLLLEHWVDRRMLPVLLAATPQLRLSGRKVYNSCHDLAQSYKPLGTLSRRLVFEVLAPEVICNSYYSTTLVQRVMPKIVGVLYPGIDTGRFRCQSVPAPEHLEPIVRSGSRIMLTPSRITAAGIMNDKNLRQLPRVLAELLALGHDWHCVIIGDDRSAGKVESHKLRELARTLGVEERFTILPGTTNIEEYYQYADIAVSLAPREPFGRTPLEAVACGIPVVGSGSGGIRETLQYFAPEWTVDPEQPRQVAQKILRILADPGTPQLLGAGQRWIEAHCSPRAYAEQLMEIIGLEAGEEKADMRVRRPFPV